VENLVFGNNIAKGTGNTSNNSITGNANANTLDGATGIDTLIGGNGDDYYIIYSANDLVIESVANTLTGGFDTVQFMFDGMVRFQNVERYLDKNGAVISVGDSRANYLIGSSGVDTIDGGAGADTMEGLAGNDYYIVDNLGDRVIEVGGNGVDSVEANVISYTLASEVEYLILKAPNGITGIGNSLANTLVGNSLSNSLSGLAGNDSLFGGGGNDTLNGGTGIDTMVGGSGNDYFAVSEAADVIVSGGGTDGIIAQYQDYTLASGFNILVLDGTTGLRGNGNSGNNTITGSIYSDTLNGNGGDDRLIGLIGNDYYIVDSAGDVVVEGASAGIDTIESRLSTTYTLGNNLESLVLGVGATHGVGNSLSNTLAGNTENNSLSGAAGRDSLSGGNGNDTLLGALATSTGGRGEIDTLTGGAGNDVFILGTAAGCLYDDGNTKLAGTTDYALITDFGSGDKLQLRGTAYTNYRLDSLNLYRELGAIDELIAVFQGTAPSALNANTVNLV
jgi:Ca2+-binding RTX toxin-like protein